MHTNSKNGPLIGLKPRIWCYLILRQIHTRLYKSMYYNLGKNRKKHWVYHIKLVWIIPSSGENKDISITHTSFLKKMQDTVNSLCCSWLPHKTPKANTLSSRCDLARDVAATLAVKTTVNHRKTHCRGLHCHTGYESNAPILFWGN